MSLVLETHRLCLRLWQEQDFEAYAQICADPEVMRYLGGSTYSRLEAWRHFAYLVGHWHLRGYGHWAVIEKSSGQLIGRLGLQNPEGWPGFELGWTLAKEAWGKGYATEGAQRVLQYAFREMKRSQVISIIHPQKQRSIRVAQKLGEKYLSKTVLLGIEVLIYGIDRQTWQDLLREQDSPV
ncbi:MAG: GNAT family N-acetyltransferase [Pseudanabaenaceae cyanobacterium bins.68]|nr:GNAT family N-acetyltransferase [Pseudanabaenaceae cyanobacterium bins.68]